jgi:ankyrin repeat protein
MSERMRAFLMATVGLCLFLQSPAQSKEEPIFRAVQSSNLEETVQLLDTGAPVDRMDENGNTPLNYACALENMELITKLLRYGASVNGFPDGEPPLFTAIKHNNHKPVMLLLQAGANQGIMRPFDGNAAYLAARYDQAATMRILLARGALTHLPEFQGNSAVHIAAQYGSTETVEVLMGAGGLGHSDRNEQGQTPLHLAATNGHEQVCFKLLQAGADPNALDNTNSSPLHYALRNRHPAAAVRLLEGGAIPMIPDAQGNFPIHFAVNADLTSLVMVLFGYGADINVPDAKGKSPLALAAAQKQTMMCRVLVQNGASMGQASIPEPLALIIKGEAGAENSPVFTKDNVNDSFEGQCYLSWAISAGKTKIVERLLEFGARTDIPDQTNGGNLPIHIAAIGGTKEVELLLARGADIDALNSKGETPLCLALANRAHVMADWLISKGAGTDVRSKGELPMVIALRSGIQTTLVMVEAGGSLEVVDLHDNWPVHIAVQNEDPILLQYLLKRGCAVNMKNEDGNTALHLAAQTGREDLLRLLLSSGADILLTNNNGKTADDLAVKNFHLKLCPLLR